MPAPPLLARRFVAILLAVAGFPAALTWAEPPLQSPGQATGGETDGSLHLHGTVVDGVTGKPIARALVTSADRRLAVMTNNDGAFSFDFTTPNSADQFRLFLRAQRPGYLQQDNNQNVAFVGGSAEVRLALMPTALVMGHVFTGSSESPRNVTVMLMGHNVVNGERTWTSMGMQRTDRTGAFRFDNLRPGEYTVMSTEWRGEQPTPPGRNEISQQYPPDFFGDTITLSSATKVHLHYGEQASADLHLRLATYYPVLVPVSSANVGGINVRVDSDNPYSGFALGYNGADHAVEGSLPEGSYTLNLSSFQPQQAFGSAVLHVDGKPLRTAPVALSPPTPVTVRLHREFTGAQPLVQANVRVYLQPERMNAPFVTGGTQQGQNDEITLQDAPPGRYRVRVEPNYGYAASIRAGGVDLQTEPYLVGEGGAAAPIDVFLRDDSGKLTGTVQAGDSSTSHGINFICLLPTSSSGNFATTAASPEGQYGLGNLVPGTYRLFATSSPPWQFPWHDPEVVRAFSGKGVELVVTPNADLQKNAPLLDDTALELP